MLWGYLPTEIRLMILQALLQDGCNVASFATVSREWQRTVEQHNFTRIKLTPSRIVDLDSMTSRNRSLVRYLWLCLELQPYDCTMCAPEDTQLYTTSNVDNALIVTALEKLFSILSAWGPNGRLSLDISIYSPSDSEHWFKYLTFEPDIPQSDKCSHNRGAEQAMILEALKTDDPQHGWTSGARDSYPPEYAIERVFGEVMSQGPFNDDGQEEQWWRQLPLVPSVTSLLLRQQNRRRWKPRALAQMLARLPRLQELYYEPWREWCDDQQEWTDTSYLFLLESIASSSLSKLAVFENFNPQYSQSLAEDCEPIRIPNSAVGRMVSNARHLEALSASFMVDAVDFFDTNKTSPTWPNLTSLIITSQLLAPDVSQRQIANLLQGAASAALRMPNIKIMEIWNGREGLAALFKYELVGGGQPSIVTWRGTWDFILQPPVIRGWEALTLKRHGCGLKILNEPLDGSVIRSHGDAIFYLKLSDLVIRPVSLQQIRAEHNLNRAHNV